MYKKIISVFCAIIMLMSLLTGCSSKKSDERISKVKEKVEEIVIDKMRSIDASNSFLEPAIDSLEFNYTREEVKGGELILEGEFSFILEDEKCIQPFSVTGNIDKDELSFSTTGKEMRVEDASDDERSRNEYVREMNKKSDGEKEGIAKQAAARAVMDKMESSTWPLYSSWYDLDKSQISYGKISVDGEDYTILGKVFLYDNYGSLSKTIRFKVFTSVDSSGYVSGTLCYLED